jgi:hypothetical protein
MPKYGDVIQQDSNDTRRFDARTVNVRAGQECVRPRVERG